MRSADYRIVRTLVLEEIRRVVAAAIQDAGRCLRASRCAVAIARAYPNSGMSADDIAEAIVEAAIRARVNVEISRPSSDDVIGLPAGTAHSAV